MAKAKNIIETESKTEYIFFLDEETIFLFPSIAVNKIVLSGNNLPEITEHKASLKAIIILAELDWQGRYLQHFYGFDIAVEIRRKHKLLCPIIITSTLKQSYFEKLASDNIKYKILFGRGIAFLPLNELNKKLNTTIENLCKYPLTEAVLADMNEMLLDQKGVVIDKLTHDLRFAKLGNNANKLEAVLNEAAAYLNNTQLDALNWMDFQKQLSGNITDAEKFDTTADKLIKECERTLVSDTKPSEAKQDKKHKILVIEDDPDFRKKSEENLKEYFEEIIITENAEDAIQKINEDGTNEITGIIADWRLYKDQTEYWQVQGYEVLDFAAKNHFAALFALTSLSDHNVHNIRNTLSLDIHLFKKQYLDISNSWKMMADTVKQKCDSVREIIDSTPTGARWILDYYDIYPSKGQKVRVKISSLKQKYAQQRNTQWNIFNKAISDSSNTMWDYYKTVVNNNIENCTITGIKDKYGIELTTDDQNLESLLKARRLFFALWFNCGNIEQTFDRKKWINKSDLKFEQFKDENPLIKIYCVFSGTSWKLYAENYMPTAGETQKNPIFINEEHAAVRIIEEAKKLANSLCIKPGDLPGKGILPEEKSWLKLIGIDLDKGNSVVDYTSYTDEESDIPGCDTIEKEPTLEDLRKIESEISSFNLPDDEDK